MPRRFCRRFLLGIGSFIDYRNIFSSSFFVALPSMPPSCGHISMPLASPGLLMALDFSRFSRAISSRCWLSADAALFFLR